MQQERKPDTTGAEAAGGCLVMLLSAMGILAGCGLVGLAWRVFRWAAGF